MCKHQPVGNILLFTQNRFAYWLFDSQAKHGRLKEDEARTYFQQLINAVDYCHSRGVYHRDLKVYQISYLSSLSYYLSSVFGDGVFVSWLLSQLGFE